MERAGEAAFSVFKKQYPHSQHWLILVGPGNNGGDGYVIARHAKAMGARVTVAVIPPTKPLPEEAAKAKAMWESSQGVETSISESWEAPAGVDLVVDGLLGTGLTGAPRGLYAQVIEQVNKLSVPRVAVDIPSGLNAETGEAAGNCFMADHTATFICLKPGLLTGAARRYVGQLHYNTLGLSQWMLDPTRIEAAVCHRISAASLPLYFNTATRSPCAHKGSNGRVLLIGGEVGYGGAILMSAEAALAAGAGLVRVFTQGEHVTPLLVRTPEVMVTTAPEATSEAFSDRLQEALSWCSVLAVGPGLGQGGIRP
ncbi:YjeF-like protein [Angomonas deanei]|nr:YjeF-like protein [Angomonas deanei]|eukprot:EPY40436.1 YjeF-like protein [Angomonas deanei]